MRSSLVAEGVLLMSDGHLKLYKFSSPSTAVAVLLGRNANGRIEWKTESGDTSRGFMRSLLRRYDPLKSHLQGVGRPAVTMSFEEIADLVGGLPNSAYRHQTWWANEREGRHVQARSWMAAGFATEGVDLERRSVTFRSDR